MPLRRLPSRRVGQLKQKTARSWWGGTMGAVSGVSAYNVVVDDGRGHQPPSHTRERHDARECEGVAACARIQPSVQQAKPNRQQTTRSTHQATSSTQHAAATVQCAPCKTGGKRRRHHLARRGANPRDWPCSGVQV
jgi:hypothetical protein